jgi:phosphoserine aminotransferase
MPPLRTFNFGGGPGAISPNILHHLTTSPNYLRSLLEDTHREDRGVIQNILVDVQQLFRDLIKLPSNYHVLFFQGGAFAQFAGIPLNLGAKTCLGVEWGSWSRTGLQEQEKYVQIKRYFPALKNLSQDSIWRTVIEETQSPSPTGLVVDYIYTCTNETMRGSQILHDPILNSSNNNKQLPTIIVDSTSDLLSREMDISKYGVVFASGGKNIGPPGFAVVFARDDLVNEAPASPLTPGIMSWREMARKRPNVANIYNTPCMLSIGIAKLVLEETLRLGGVSAMEKRNIEWSKALYEEIDSSYGFYSNVVPIEFRSRVNVVFRIAPGDLLPEDTLQLESAFLRMAREEGLLQLVNHPSIGGLRVSLYNGMDDEGVEKLLAFMRTFRKTHGRGGPLRQPSFFKI